MSLLDAWYYITGELKTKSKLPRFETLTNQEAKNALINCINDKDQLACKLTQQFDKELVNNDELINFLPEFFNEPKVHFIRKVTENVRSTKIF